jgi:ATP-binding cassette subfamily B protein
MLAPKPARWLFSMAPGAWPDLVRSILLACAAALLFPVPIFMAWLILRQFLAQGAAPGLPVLPCLAALGALLLAALCRALSSHLSHKAAFALNTGVCTAALEHLGRLPLHWFAGQSTGGLRKVLGHELEQVENFIAHNVTDGVAALLLPVVTVVALFFVSVPLALVMLALMAAAVICHLGSLALMMKKSTLTQDYLDSLELLHADAVEFVEAMPDIKIFNRTTESFSRMQRAIRRFKEIQLMVRKVFVRRWVVFLTLTTTSFGALAAAGAYLHLAGLVPFEDVVLFLMLGVASFAPLSRLVRFVSLLWRAGMGYANVKALLETPVEARGTRQAAEIASPDLRVDGLCVDYEGKSVLRDVSFTARAGRVTAIVGHSGSGKSTVAAVIAGLERASSGTVSVGGIPLEDFSGAQLARVMGMVFQQPFIFSATVAENIALGSPGATPQAIREAAELVRCHEFIAGLPNGYDTRIGAGGEVHLSGGQRQRIALARMALRDAPVVLLDEATAFADPESEAAIQEGLASFLAGRTVLVIAHRLPSIAGADSIIVLERGRVAQAGTHGELLARDGVYARMWDAYATARSWMITSDEPPAPGRDQAAQGAPSC